MEALCTCHKPPRPCTRNDESEEWAHRSEVLIGDMEYAEMFHVHVQRSSRDCDGPHEHDHTYQIPSLNWDYIGKEPTAENLWDVLCSHMPTYSGGLEAKTHENNSGGITLVWHRRTDEGYEGEEIIGCTDPTCAYDDDFYRDVFAERAGY